jgi:hypothetical protein
MAASADRTLELGRGWRRSSRSRTDGEALEQNSIEVILTFMKSLWRTFILILLALEPAEMNAASTVYFLVAEPPGRVVHGDSYVLPLARQEDIEHARYLIALGSSVFSSNHLALVVAYVVAANDDINRNFVDPRLPRWSWQITEFLAFSDATMEILDGSPTQLEGGIDWSSPGSGVHEIGFWNYTVVRELGPVPLYLSVLPDRENLEIYWSSIGTNHVYTLEELSSLGTTNWLAIPGASWPVKTNHWTLPLANATVSFFRVRAEQAP